MAIGYDPRGKDSAAGIPEDFIAGADIRAGMLDSTVTFVANLRGRLRMAVSKAFREL